MFYVSEIYSFGIEYGMLYLYRMPIELDTRPKLKTNILNVERYGVSYNDFLTIKYEFFVRKTFLIYPVLSFAAKKENETYPMLKRLPIWDYFL